MFLEIDLPNINPIAPTTILGLISAIFFYLYSSYKNNKDNEVKEIESIQSDKKKTEVIEMRLNAFGTRIPTAKLKPEQKFALLKKLIREKTLRYLITAITSIISAVIIAIVLYFSNQDDYKATVSDLHFSRLVEPKNYFSY